MYRNAHAAVGKREERENVINNGRLLGPRCTDLCGSLHQGPLDPMATQVGMSIRN